MKNIIATTSQQTEQSPIVTLYELNLTDRGEGIFRFCNLIDFDIPVKYNGYDYIPLPIDVTGFKFSGQGTISRPKLKIATLDLSIRSLVIKTKLNGVPFRRIRIHADNLDNGIDPNPFATYTIDYYVVDRRTQHTRELVEYELTTEFDREGKKIPGWDILKNACTHVYRSYNPDTGNYEYSGTTCPYTDNRYYDTFGVNQTDPAKDSCGKRLADCQKRFPDQPLPYKGFPGVQKR